MNKLSIEKTDSTPSINFDPEKRLLVMEGRSYPENTAHFYHPVFQWITEYFEQVTSDSTVIAIDFIYFNSSTSKVLFDLFDVCEQKAKEGKSINVRWMYDEENECCLEYGEEFMEDMEHIKFELLKK